MIFQFEPGGFMSGTAIRAGLTVLFQKDGKKINSVPKVIAYRWPNGTETEEHPNGLTRVYGGNLSEKDSEVIRSWLSTSR